MNNPLNSPQQTPRSPIDSQYLLDYAQIRDVQEHYFQAVDRNDEAGIRACFTADLRATYHARPTQHGVDGLIEGIMRPPMERLRTGLTKCSTHFMGNFIVERIAGDAAQTETYAIVVLVHAASAAGAGADQAVTIGIRYLDRWRRDGNGEGWRIAERVQTFDWKTEQSAVDAVTLAQRISRP